MDPLPCRDGAARARAGQGPPRRTPPSVARLPAVAVMGVLMVVVRGRARRLALRGRASETTQGVSVNCQEVLFSTMPQVAIRAPFGVGRQALWPSSKSRPCERQVQSASGGGHTAGDARKRNQKGQAGTGACGRCIAQTRCARNYSTSAGASSASAISGRPITCSATPSVSTIEQNSHDLPVAEARELGQADDDLLAGRALHVGEAGERGGAFAVGHHEVARVARRGVGLRHAAIGGEHRLLAVVLAAIGKQLDRADDQPVGVVGDERRDTRRFAAAQGVEEGIGEFTGDGGHGGPIGTAPVNIDRVENSLRDRSRLIGENTYAAPRCRRCGRRRRSSRRSPTASPRTSRSSRAGRGPGS